MSTFEGEVLRQTVAVARQHKIEPEALLAVVETESAGKSLEVDGKTPCLLFERHIFYRELKKAGKTGALHNAVAAGLANVSWSPKTQYRDQNTSANRLALYARAKAVDAECAARSCSWGVGQTMGFLAEELHFPNAVTMLEYMTEGGIPAQVEAMVREIDNKKLGPKLNAHNWAGFARVYNGPGYAQNHYDSKMAVAYAKWKKAGVDKLLGVGPLTPTQMPKPVVVSQDLKPTKPVTPPSPVTSKQAGIGAAIAAGFAGIWVYVRTAEFQIVAAAVFLLVLAVITAIVLLHRRNEADANQLGVLSTIDGGAS